MPLMRGSRGTCATGRHSPTCPIRSAPEVGAAQCRRRPRDGRCCNGTAGMGLDAVLVAVELVLETGRPGAVEHVVNVLAQAVESRRRCRRRQHHVVTVVDAAAEHGTPRQHCALTS